MTDTTDDDYEPAQMTRRQALKGGSAAAVAAGSYLLQQQLVQRAAAQTNEPRIQLGSDWVIDDNPSGAGSFVVEHTPNTNSYEFADSGTLTLPKAQPAELDVTNETFVRLNRQSDSSTASAGTFINPYDNVDRDVRGETNSSAQFTPDKTGEYTITVAISFQGSFSGDTVNARVRNLDVGSNIVTASQSGVSLSPYFGVWPFPTVELTAGTTYEVQTTNFDSSFSISASSVCIGSIEWVPVG